MSRIKTLLITTLGIVVCILFWQPCSVLAKDDPNPCDPNLRVAAKDPRSYTFREDRCEGVYLQDIPITLQIVSLVESFEDYDLQLAQGLNVEWTAPEEQQVNLRAHSLQPGFDYRMDTVRPAGDTNYLWPIDILQTLGITRRDIGVVSWTRHSFNGTDRDVYLPLRISQQRSPEQATQYRIILWSWRELQEVFISLATVSVDGSPSEFIVDGRPLEYGYYPAGRGIEFTIPKPGKAGIYYLEIGATLSKGGVVTIEHWFYSNPKSVVE